MAAAMGSPTIPWARAHAAVITSPCSRPPTSAKSCGPASADGLPGRGLKIGQRDGRLVELYLFVALVYFLICFTASRLVKRLEKRARVR